MNPDDVLYLASVVALKTSYSFIHCIHLSLVISERKRNIIFNSFTTSVADQHLICLFP